MDTLAHRQTQPNPVVRLAELQIDPGQLEEYKAALREEIEASIRLEPGVLALYAVKVSRRSAARAHEQAELSGAAADTRTTMKAKAWTASR